MEMASGYFVSECVTEHWLSCGCATTHVPDLLTKPHKSSSVHGICVQGNVASLEDLVREITSGNARVVLPPELCHEEHAYGAVAPDNNLIVWRCSTFGGFIMAGSITIVPNGVLLLSGNGAHFKDTTFIGMPRLI